MILYFGETNPLKLTLKLLLTLYLDLGNPFWNNNNPRHNDSLIQLVNVPRELKIRFEDLEYDSKMVGEGKEYHHVGGTPCSSLN